MYYKNFKFAIRRIDEGGVNRILKNGKDGFVILSAHCSEIYSGNPDVDLSDEYTKWSIDNALELDEPMKKFLQERNKEAGQQLKRDIQQAGYSYTPVFGGYKAKDQYEPLYVVYSHGRGGVIDKKSFDELKNFAQEMCGKYQQDGVFVWPPRPIDTPSDDIETGAPIYINARGEKTNATSTTNDIINDYGQEYFTASKRKKREVITPEGEIGKPKRFTSDILFESFKHEMYAFRGPSDYSNRMRRIMLGEVFLF